MSRSMNGDVEALAIQDYLSQKPDALVFAVAATKFPVPPTVRQWGAVDTELTLTKERVAVLMNERLSAYDFNNAVAKIVNDPTPTQSIIGTVLLNVFLDLLSYHKEVEVAIAQISRDEAIAREGTSMMKRVDKQFSKKPSEFDAADYNTLKELLQAPENVKYKASFEKKMIAIDEDYKGKIGTPIKMGDIQKGIEEKAREFTYNVTKRLWNEASRFIVVKPKEPVQRV